MDCKCLDSNFCIIRNLQIWKRVVGWKRVVHPLLWVKFLVFSMYLFLCLDSKETWVIDCCVLTWPENSKTHLNYMRRDALVSKDYVFCISSHPILIQRKWIIPRCVPGAEALKCHHYDEWFSQFPDANSIENMWKLQEQFKFFEVDQTFRTDQLFSLIKPWIRHRHSWKHI